MKLQKGKVKKTPVKTFIDNNRKKKKKTESQPFRRFQKTDNLEIIT